MIRIKAVNLQATNKARERIATDYATVGNTYTMLKYWTRPPTAVTHKPQIKRKEKGVATSLFASALCWPLASLVPRRQRVLRRHVLSCSHVHRTLTCASQHVRFLQEVSHPLQYSDLLSPTNTTLRPLKARRIRLSTNRERTRSPPPAFLVTVTGSFFYQHLADVLPDFPPFTPPP